MDLSEVENQILGTYMAKQDLFDGIENLVFKSIFSNGIKRNAYEIIKSNYQNKTATDIVLLRSQLIKAGYDIKQIGLVVSKMTYDANTATNPKPKVQILFDSYVQSVLAPLLHEGAVDFHSGNGNTWDVIERIKNKITDIDAVVNNVNKTTSIGDIFEKSLAKLKDLKEGKVEAGYTIGLKDLMITKGVTVIGAVPGAGKSSLIVSIIKTLAIDRNIPVTFFSIEMSAEQIMTNLWANMFDFNTYALSLGDVDDGQIKTIEASKQKFKNNIIIDDNPNVTWQYVESKFRQIRKTIPINTMIVGFIDYIQIMSASADESKENTETKMSIRCSKLANLSKQYNIGLIELSQLSREVGKRNPPRPMISDLKESGAIEANAQQIWLMYRPDYYDKNAVDEKGESLKGICEINRAKNRYGPTGYTYVRFKAQYSQFLDREENHEF